MRRYLLPLLWVFAAWQAAQAAPIYQWVDEQGRVFFGDSPPAHLEVRRLQVLPGPSPAEIEAARERAETLRQLADEMAAERRRRAAEAAEAAAMRHPAPMPDILILPQREVRHYAWPYDPRRFRGRPPYPGHKPPGSWRPPYPGRPPPPIETPYEPDPLVPRIPPRAPGVMRPGLTPELGR